MSVMSKVVSAPRPGGRTWGVVVGKSTRAVRAGTS